MKRLALVLVVLGVLLFAAAPAAAQRFRAFYGRPYVDAPRMTYWSGYYAPPVYVYRPYTTFYAYPYGRAWGYPRYYSSYPVVPYYYGW